MLADDISLRVPDMESFIENLNTAGYLLKKGPRLYQVRTTSHDREASILESDRVVKGVLDIVMIGQFPHSLTGRGLDKLCV